MASKIRNPQEIKPPTKDAMIPKPKARPGLPFRAIGYPSSVVITEAGVPGMRKSVAVIRPPEMDPTYIETSSTIASVGCMA